MQTPRTPATLRYLIAGLVQRAQTLLDRACREPMPAARMLAITSTAMRARARAAQLQASLNVGQAQPWRAEFDRAMAYMRLASGFAHAADLRGA